MNNNAFRHACSYLPHWLIRGIFERRHTDPSAAELVASWRAQGILPPESPTR